MGSTIIDVILVGMLIVFIGFIGVLTYDMHFNKDIATSQVKLVSVQSSWAMDECMHTYVIDSLNTVNTVKANYVISHNLSSEITVKNSIFYGKIIIDVKPLGQDLPAQCGVYK
jgi:hypothetical protein